MNNRIQRKDISSTFPLLLQASKLDYYIDPNNGKFIRLKSPHPRSRENAVNNILTRIEAESGTYSYLGNRLREWVSLSVLQVHLRPSQCALSSIMEDILCGIDAHCKIGDYSYQVDFTEHGGKIEEKCSAPKEKFDLHHDQDQERLIFYIEEDPLTDLMFETEEFLRHSPSYMGNIDTIRARMQYLWEEKIRQDLLPHKLAQGFVPSGSSHAQHIAIHMRVSLEGILSRNNPPPFR